jgi:hypothetical protein
VSVGTRHGDCFWQRPAVPEEDVLSESHGGVVAWASTTETRGGCVTITLLVVLELCCIKPPVGGSACGSVWRKRLR